MKRIKLSKSEIDLSEDKMKWGEREIVRFTLINPNTGTISPESMLDSKIKRFGFAIKKIIENGKDIPFSKEWVMNLSEEDGALIAQEINLVDEKKNIELTPQKSLEEKELVI